MIDLVLTHKPFDRIESPGASLPLFTDQRPLRHQAALVDWRLNGKVSQLIEEERLQGKLGESLLMPTKGRLQASALFLYGLGSFGDWDPNAAENIFTQWTSKLSKLNLEQWLLSLTPLATDFLSWRHCLRSFVSHLAQASPSGRCTLVFSEHSPWVMEAKKRNMDFGADVQLTFDLAS